MKEKHKSFDDFYYRESDKIEDLEYLIKFVESNNDKVGKFEGEMFCPECKKAELHYVHKTSKRRAHLRRCRTSSHNVGCSYIYDYATKSQTKEIFNSFSYNEIQDKLNSIINMLCKEPRKNRSIEHTEINRKSKDNPMLVSIENNSDNIVRALRRKKLNAWIDASDYDEFFIFYGKVKLEVEKKQKTIEGKEPYSYYILKVYNPDKNSNWKFRTSIYRGKIKDNIVEDNLYYIAIVGQVGKKAWQIDMLNDYAIKYCKCED